MEKGSMQEWSIHSHLLDESIPLLIYLPPQFSQLYKYPLLIVQDGKDYFQLGRLARTVDELLHEKKMQPTIIIGIPYQNISDRREKYHPQGKKHNSYISFLAKELIPFLEQKLPVLHMGSSRALAGDSLAATVSLLTALQYPHTFGNVMLHSPFVNEDVLNQVEAFKNWELLKIYHVIGKEETEVKLTDGSIADFLTPNRKLQQLISTNTLEYFYEEFAGNHTWTYWQKDLKRALSFIYPISN